MGRPSIGDRMGVRFGATVRLELGAAAAIRNVPIAEIIRAAVEREIALIRNADEPTFRKALKAELQKCQGDRT